MVVYLERKPKNSTNRQVFYTIAIQKCKARVKTLLEISDSPGDKSLKKKQNKTNQNTQYISSLKQNNTILFSLQAELMLQKVLWIFPIIIKHDLNIQVFFFQIPERNLVILEWQSAPGCHRQDW